MSKFIYLQDEKKLERARELLQARKDARGIEPEDWDGQIQSHDEASELATLQGWKAGALENIGPLYAERDALKAENRALLGRATTAEIDLGREKIKYEELDEMMTAAVVNVLVRNDGHRYDDLMDKFVSCQFIRDYHPCEDCSCPVREGEKTCEWCEAEQKGTA